MVLLRKLRQEKGLSCKKLEQATGVGEIAIRNIENKMYKTSNDRLQKLADYFGIKEPLELLENVTDTLQVKSCLNQRCLLNKQCYCQSDQVIEGAYCQSENKVSDQVKEVKFNSTQALFIN